MKNLNSHSWWAVILTGLVLKLAAASLKIELPAETGTFKSGPGVEIANGQCLVCHSVEYVATQPSLPRTFWASSVKKMREKYGATIPDAQVETLLDYLTVHYGIAPTNQASTLITNAAPQVKVESAPDAAAIAARYGCLGCHAVSTRIVGPSYREIAAKYRHAPDARTKMTEQIQKGGSGKWGPIIMPPFPQLTEAEIKALTGWILGQE